MASRIKKKARAPAARVAKASARAAAEPADEAALGSAAPVLAGQLAMPFAATAFAVSSCRYHGPGDCCTKCPEHAATDGRSFPHPSERRGRRPLKVCPGCDEALPAEGWDAAHPYSCLCAKCIRGVEEAQGEG